MKITTMIDCVNKDNPYRDAIIADEFEINCFENDILQYIKKFEHDFEVLFPTHSITWKLSTKLDGSADLVFCI